MANRDEEIPIHHQDHDYVDDYDVDFMDVLMNLNDQMEGASNSDDSPFNDSTMNSNTDRGNLEGRYFVLDPEDIVCGGMPEEMRHHPGKVFFERMVANFVVPYGLATRASETQLILAEIYSQIEMVSQRAGRRPLRYAVPTVPSDGLPYYQEASQDEIMKEIKFSIRSHFNVIPTPNDVLFGRGQPCRDFPGNVRFRTFIDNHSGPYASAGPMDRERIIQETKETVTAVGGRFLLPFDNARPSDGCVEASDLAIRKKIKHIYRDNTPARRSIEMAQALPS